MEESESEEPEDSVSLLSLLLLLNNESEVSTNEYLMAMEVRCS